MNVRTIVYIFLSFFIFDVKAQVVDSVKQLNEITVKGYHNRQVLLRSVSTVSLIDSSQIKNQNTASFVGIANTVPGVRMEERSPGSYRFSLRGSLLRSPFGIRNVKIYIDDFPLTDAGGNTYLNLMDVRGAQSFEIYRGPEASMFGSNTGGAVLISSPSLDKNSLEIGASAGSFGLFQQHAHLTQQHKNYRFSVTQGFQKSDGYRENSGLERKYIQSTHQWDYNTNGKLNAFIFLSDLAYKTPGGLTEQQFTLNPRSARPATAVLPGAITQQAGIYNKTIFAGLSHTYLFDKNLKHVTALFTSYTDFKNPFITNYEKRYENTIGLRTFLDHSFRKTNFSLNTHLGVESSSSKSSINNFNNLSGSTGSLLAKDDLSARQTFAFIRTNFDIGSRLLIELGSSVNLSSYRYRTFFPQSSGEKSKTFSTQLMPKFAASYVISPIMAFRGTISKGYSPPTLAEVRSSDNLINVDLQPEYGWNYELGVRLKSVNNRFYFNANAFSYRLKSAIVRRLNENDTEYFINAGGTKQKGIELEFSSWLIPFQQNKLISSLRLRNSYTYSEFRFDQFVNTNTDFSGNKLTGVPDHVVVSSIELTFRRNIFLFGQHNYTSSIPLNDANTAVAKAYHLTDLKTGFRNLTINKTRLDLFFGINNLFNAKYSLGNDLNAVAGRYFNAASTINVYTGFVLKF